MSNDKKKNDIALSIVLQLLEEINSNDILIANYQKEIEQVENKNKKDIRAACIKAANYFTSKKITEIHEKSKNLLHCDDFNKEEYINKFTDISTIDLDDIAFLAHREQEIAHSEFESNNAINNQKNMRKPYEDTLLNLAELFLLGGANDD